MNPPAASDAAAAPPQTALAAAWARQRRRGTRTIAFMVVLCVAIALLLSTFERGQLGTHLVYSFSIGLCCWSLVEGTRLLLAWGTDRFRRARGLPPGPAGFDSGWRGIVPAMLLAMPLGPLLGMSIADFLTGNQSPSLLQLQSTNTRITVVMTIIGSLASVFVLSTMERLSSARAQAELAQRQAAENQLRLLQSQLEPHMLFNTLANLRVLIALDPPRAQAMLDRMIAYLRATLAASRVGQHALADEFERVSDYLALMAVRMGPRLQVQLDLPDELRTLPVPPLLLQPLVENAIKHGLEPKVEGGRIEVQARREANQLLLTVRDTGVGASAPANATAGSGFGLSQVRARLQTLYGPQATLSLDAAPDADGGFLARVSLPLA